ncbi:MAG: hypothetical protein ACHQF4_07865 [Sphingobacteriales bacterium]
MKSLVFTLLTVFIGMHAVFAQEPDVNQYYDFQLKIIKANKITVKDVYKYHISHNGNKTDSTLSWSINYIYDSDGNIVKQRFTDNKGKLYGTYDISYNSAGQVVERKVGIINAPAPYDSLNFKYLYDTTGTEIAEINNNNLLRMPKIIQKQYDNNGKWVRTISKVALNNAKGDAIVQDSLFYDTDGNLNTRQYYSSTGIKASAVIYSYEIQNDRKTVTVFFQKDGKQRFSSKTIYNKNGQIVQSTDTPYYDPYSSNYDDMNKLEKFYYNENGTLNTSIGYADGEVKYILKFIYK